MADSMEQFLDIIDNRIEKHLNFNTSSYIKQRLAKVIEVDTDSQKVYVYFVDDENQTQYVYYNKTNEIITSGDNVKVFYTSDIIKGWIGARCGEPSVKEITIYGGEGVGRKSEFDETSEYFNSYVGSYANIAGKEGNSNYATARGLGTKATGYCSTAEGYYTTASGNSSHAEGNGTQATGTDCHAEGYETKATGYECHAEGSHTQATGSNCHAEGNNTKATNDCDHAEGLQTTASGGKSHAEGSSTKALAYGSHAEGTGTQAKGSYSHAEGYYNVASGVSSHAEGDGTIASGEYSHAGGKDCVASGYASFAGGYNCIASISESFAYGSGLKMPEKPLYNGTAVLGTYNDYSDNKIIFSIGNGGGDNNRSNAFAVDIDGNIYCSGIKSTGDNADKFIPYTSDQAITAATTTFNNIME